MVGLSLAGQNGKSKIGSAAAPLHHLFLPGQQRGISAPQHRRWCQTARFGSERMNITKNIQKQRIDHKGPRSCRAEQVLLRFRARDEFHKIQSKSSGWIQTTTFLITLNWGSAGEGGGFKHLLPQGWLVEK